MYAIGVDIGFANTGIAVEDVHTGRLVYTEVCTTSALNKKIAVRAAESNIERCMKISRALSDAIDKYSPCSMFVELPHGGARSANAMRAMAYAAGVIATVVELKGIPVCWLTPSNIKEGVTGDKSASKIKVQKSVANQYPEWKWIKTLKVEHEADAAACIIVGRRTSIYRMQKSISGDSKDVKV